MHKSRSEIKEIIEEYKEALQKLGVNVKRIILYGSFAKGIQREDSDIDLIVVSNDFRDMNLRERAEILGIAAVRIMRSVEAKGYTPRELRMVAQASFLKEILNIGISL